MLSQLFLLSLLLFADSIAAAKSPNGGGHHKGGKRKGGPVPPPPVLDKKFLTLNGGPPVVVARGGYSGILPDSSGFAYSLASATSLKESVMYCNLQMTKDNMGLCTTDIRLDVSTTTALAFPKGENTYNVNGKDIRGWFTMDFTAEELSNSAFYVQNVLTRTNVFDGILPVMTPDDIVQLHPNIWVNVEYDSFYNLHKLSAAKYLEDSAGYWVPTHISSPEIDFLKYMSGKVDRTKTKLIFKFLGNEEVEPTTKQTYGLILSNLATIQPFVSGILVPKEYVVPITKDKYSDVPTTLVADAHKLGLEVYASGFANDMFTSYNYSYDPVTEYLQFIDNPQFSIDGMLTDFPSTASNSIACFAQSKNNSAKIVKTLVISNNGASGDFPGCTDLAYQKAADDGADIIDCNVQMSKDGVAFCLPDIDLTATTTAITAFIDRSSTVPEIKPQSGIFSFDLDWSEIESLKPTIEVPVKDGPFLRNPKNKNKGKFVTLADFLELAKTKKTGGVMINIENAAYLASKKGLGVIDAVTTALANASFDKQTIQKVMIQSSDTSVLSEFKKFPTYERVLNIQDIISEAPADVVAEIKKNADAVVIGRYCIVQINSAFFSTAITKVVDELHAGNISVYVTRFRNEFVYLDLDHLADPYLELATFASLNVDGVITDYPATASAFMRNPCSDFNNKNNVISIRPIVVGDMTREIDPAALPPALPPNPALEKADIVDPPLPPVTKAENGNTAQPPAEAQPKYQKSSAPRSVGDMGIVSIVVTLFFGLRSFV